MLVAPSGPQVWIETDRQTAVPAALLCGVVPIRVQQGAGGRTAGTSLRRTCGHREQEETQARFICVLCSFENHADVVARSISERQDMPCRPVEERYSQAVLRGRNPPKRISGVRRALPERCRHLRPTGQGGCQIGITTPP